MLSLVPITLTEANEFIRRLHRNHKPVVGHKFSIGVAQCVEITDDDGPLKIVGVAVVGRPVSRHLDNGWCLEVTRCCTDGTRNACSLLYGASWRAAKALGYKKLITYTLPHEGGAALRGAGWRCVGEAGGGNWNVKSRPRVDSPHPQKKLRWEADQCLN